MSKEQATLACHGVLELLGHRRLAGYLTEEQIAGFTFIRIDIPGPDETTITQYYNPASLYGITPCTEEAAVVVAANCQPEPVQYYDVQPMVKQLVERELRRIKEYEQSGGTVLALDDNDGPPF